MCISLDFIQSPGSVYLVVLPTKCNGLVVNDGNSHVRMSFDTKRKYGDTDEEDGDHSNNLCIERKRERERNTKYQLEQQRNHRMEKTEKKSRSL